MTSMLRKKTAKSNTTVKRIAKNVTKTKRIAKSEDTDNEYAGGWNYREEQTFIRDSGIYDTYSSMRGNDSWD